MENLGETSQFQRIALQCHQTWQGENPLKLFSIGCCTCHHFLFYWRFEWENHRSKWWMSRIATLDLPSGKRLHSYGKSLLLMGKSTISTGPFSSSLFVCLPGRVLDDKSSTNHHPHEICHFFGIGASPCNSPKIQGRSAKRGAGRLGVKSWIGLQIDTGNHGIKYPKGVI